MLSLNKYIAHATKHSHQGKRRGCLLLAGIPYSRLLSTATSTCGRSTGKRPSAAPAAQCRHQCMSLSHNFIMALLQKQWPAGFGHIVAAAEVVAQVCPLITCSQTLHDSNQHRLASHAAGSLLLQACTEPASASQEPQEQPLMQSGDDSDVVYVNERQRDRILKRREQRAKLDAKLQQASGVRKVKH